MLPKTLDGEAMEAEAVQAEERDRTMERAKQSTSLVEFFRSMPMGGKQLDLTRKRDATRTLKW